MEKPYARKVFSSRVPLLWAEKNAVDRRRGIGLVELDSASYDPPDDCFCHVRAAAPHAGEPIRTSRRELKFGFAGASTRAFG